MRLHNERSVVTGFDIGSNVIVKFDKYGERVMRKGFGVSFLKREKKREKNIFIFFTRNLLATIETCMTVPRNLRILIYDTERKKNWIFCTDRRDYCV